MKKTLLKKCTENPFVGIVGVGYVGLPLVVAFASAGRRVIAVDNDPEKITAIKNGRSYVENVDSAVLSELVEGHKIYATTRYDSLVDVDAIIICVPTPLKKTMEPDISYIVAAIKSILSVISYKDKIIVLESTTYPGTTEEVVLPMLDIAGMTVGGNFFLAYSPERISPGKSYTIYDTPKIVGGTTPLCLATAMALYSHIVKDPYPVHGTKIAEMAKILENTFRAVNIALANEMAIICDRLGISVWDVIDAATTKPYGFMPFYPGPGLGGHCIPVDPLYLSWKLRQLDYEPKFISLAAKINAYMPHHVVDKIFKILNESHRAVRDTDILILGVAYKPNVSDIRESPAIDIMLLLKKLGANITYHDPYVETIEMYDLLLTSTPVLDHALRSTKCVVIVTDHDVYDWEHIYNHTRAPILDTRNAIKIRGALVHKL